MRITRNKKLAALVALGVLAAGGATAYWTTTGTGTGSATTGTSASVVVSQVGTITALRPGSPAQDINFKINNPQATNQYITSVTVAFGTMPVGCGASNFTLTQPTWTAQDLVPGDTTFSANGATLKLENLASNQDACKSVTIPLTFTAS